MRCVERSASLFCAQEYKDCELIIYNTDVSHPISLGDSFAGENIKVFNCDTDEVTGEIYDNVGSIRRDALSKATGDYYICWDDDDIFLPWNNLQCFNKINGTSLAAWKPQTSMASLHSRGPELSQNVMEASYIVRMSSLLECGFELHVGGKEHMKWVHKFNREKTCLIDYDSIPAYSFNWSDPRDIGGHKNSGTIDREDNYQLHRRECTDIHTRPIEKIDVRPIVAPYVLLLKENRGKVFKDHTIPSELYDKYVSKYEEFVLPKSL